MSKHNHYEDGPDDDWNRKNWARAYRFNSPYKEWVCRADIVKRDKSTCYLCGRVLPRYYVEFDHVIPLSRGGNHSFENIRVICRRCNVRKGTKLLSELDTA